MKLEPENHLAYRARLKQVMDEEAMVREAQLREEAALEKGAQGEKEGMGRDLLEMKVMDIEAIAELTMYPVPAYNVI